MVISEKVGVATSEMATRCINCTTLATGRFCSECGESHAVSSNPYLLVADAFLKLSEIKRYVVLYLKLLRSPTRGTIRTFEACGLADGVRFLGSSIHVYALALGISGFVLFTGNHLITTIALTVWLFVIYSASYTLYYLAMRNKGTRRRTSREFITFCCLTLGFTFPFHAIKFFIGLGTVVTLVLEIPLLIYMVRAWKYFWGASSGRIFWSLFGCTFAGYLSGVPVFVLDWLKFGVPYS